MSWDPFDPEGWFMKRSLHFNRDAEPIDMDEWSRLHQDYGYIVVNKTQVRDCEVSTVWIGLDYGLPMRPEDPPIIFETMIFGGRHHQFQVRYRTEFEAMEGHGMIVARLENHMDPWPSASEEDMQLPNGADGTAGPGA